MSKLIRLSSDEKKGIFKSGNTFALVDLETNNVVASGTNLELLCKTDEWEIPSVLVAAGMSEEERRRKAQRQARDSNGRFTGVGANVKYYSNGTEWSGVVRAIKDGQAYVDVRMPDGSVSQRRLKPNTLSVYTSKARIPSGNSLQDENDDTGGFIERNRPKIVAGAEDGGVEIQRADGYSVDAKKGSGDNTLMYQLYAPDGRSLGIYNEEGETEFDGIIASDAEENSSSTEPVQVVRSSGHKVPDNVRMTALSFLEKNQDDLTESQLNIVSSLANEDTVQDEVLDTVQEFFRELDELMKMYGGEDAKDWSRTVKEHPPHDFDREDNMDYFAVASDELFADVHLVAVDSFTGHVLGWENGSFCFDLGNIESFDSEFIVPLDRHSAKEVALQLGNEQFSNLFTEERNLFALAQDEINFSELDRIATLAYDSSDRSYDAGTQTRSGGGKFVETVDQSASSSDTKYFAIVDSTDQQAVLDVVAIQNKGGLVSVFKREGGLWVPSPELQSQIQGATPPAVSVLSDESILKDVLSQVDTFDLEDEPDPEELVASAIFTDSDLQRYMEFSGPYTDYVYKRAKALNRLDLIPEDWRLHGSLSSESSLYGEYGEVIVASGVGADSTPLEKLENYWLKGKGSEKISWGTPSGVSDGYKVFSKFLGTQRAFAFATILNNKYSGV